MSKDKAENIVESLIKADKTARQEIDNTSNMPEASEKSVESEAPKTKEPLTPEEIRIIDSYDNPPDRFHVDRGAIDPDYEPLWVRKDDMNIADMKRKGWKFPENMPEGHPLKLTDTVLMIRKKVLGDAERTAHVRITDERTQVVLNRFYSEADQGKYGSGFANVSEEKTGRGRRVFDMGNTDNIQWE